MIFECITRSSALAFVPLSFTMNMFKIRNRKGNIPAAIMIQSVVSIKIVKCSNDTCLPLILDF